jgi:hypothetical protein
MRYQHTDDLLGHAIEEAYYEICVLGEEMREAYDGTPEPLKDSAGRSREIAADLLEDASPPFVPAAVENQSITWIEKHPSPSRKLFRPAVETTRPVRFGPALPSLTGLIPLTKRPFACARRSNKTPISSTAYSFPA